MPTVQTGAVLSSTIAAQKIPIDMDTEIRFEETGSYRFEYFTRQIRPFETHGNMKVEWMEQELYPNRLVVTAASSGTTISVDHPEYAHTDQLIYNTRTGEMYLMNEDIGGSSAAGKITVVNQSGSGNITTACAVGDVLLVLPEAHAEGETIPGAYTAKPAFFFTYIMQSDKTLKYSDISQNQAEYGLNQYLADRKQAWIERKRGINLSLLVNKQMRETTSASGPRRHTSQGLFAAVTTNKIDMSLQQGTIGLAMLGELMRNTTRISASSDTKIGIAGQNAMASLSAIPVAQILTSVTETEWGKKLTSVRTPFGNLSFDWDKSLSDEFGLADTFLILDPKSLYRLQFQGLPERMMMNVYMTTDIHNTTDVFTGTWGLKVVLEKLNAVVTGIR
jgi:hypothetical protein